MRCVKSVFEMAALAREWSFDPQTALVPTMGALHAGHLKLVKTACSQADRVIVSIFVNPLQFGPAEDFERYPRDLEGDIALLAAAGADLLFAPDGSEFTPPSMRFSVDPGALGDRLCGQYRPGHFRGVATIVSKLLHVVRPGQAFFGWKDAQQFLLLQKMVHDLNMPLVLHGVETEREADGLAMSSRNAYLTPAQRAAAPSIYQGLTQATALAQSGQMKTSALLAPIKDAIARQPELRLQYAEAVRMDTLDPIDKLVPGNTLIAVAVYAGETRLIDNLQL